MIALVPSVSHGDRLIVVDGTGFAAAQVAELSTLALRLLATGLADAVMIVRSIHVGHRVELHVAAGPDRKGRMARLRATIAAVAIARGEVLVDDVLSAARSRGVA